MYAMNGKLSAQPGKRAQLADILLRAAKTVSTLPGCRAYIVSEDVKDETAIWVFEIWVDKDAHADSLKNEKVRALISEAMPILEGASSGSELRVLGGHGVDSAISS